MAGTLSCALRLIGVGETGVAWAGSFTICEGLLFPTLCFKCPCTGGKLVTSPSVQQSGLHPTWKVQKAGLSYGGNAPYRELLRYDELPVPVSRQECCIPRLQRRM